MKFILFSICASSSSRWSWAFAFVEALGRNKHAIVASIIRIDIDFPLSHLSSAQRERVSSRRKTVTNPAGIDLRELGAEQEDLRRIINPQQEHHKGACRAIRRSDRAHAQIERCP